MRKKAARFRLLRNLLFFVGLIVLTFVLIFKDQDMNKINDVLKSANISYVLLGLFFMFMYFLTEAFNIRHILKVLGEGKISILKALKFTFIGFFFSSITPAATGGQPVEVYYMTKENIKSANGVLTLLMEVCGFQISTISFGIICAILNPTILKGGLFWLFLLGITVNSIALLVMMFCIFSPRITQKLLNIFIKILRKFKVKNLELKKQKMEEELNRYNESSKFIKEHKGEFVKSVFNVFIQITFYYLVPYCIYKSFGLNEFNVFQMFSMQAILYSTVSGLPLPGAIGVSETVFLKIFGVAFGTELLGGSMLLSRGVTFYIYVIFGFIVFMTTAIKKKNINGEIDNSIESFEEEEKELSYKEVNI